ncbi:hypothetical protein [Janthinobacterium sp. Ant5-2-1]|uniref:hypothetical protein n=1 Tax=Janthinobacterium sp. Ant5-2-1 TaxID=1755239 RepID=UPI000717ECA7|nr:hypothetical protein [Janthinobacterium sp. Ant5-2-1]
MDKKSPISRLADAGIGFDGSPLRIKKDTEESATHSQTRFDVHRHRKFKFKAVVGLVVLIGAAAAYFYNGGIWIYYD